MRRERHADVSLKTLSDALKALCTPDPRISPAEPVLLTTAEASTGGLLAAAITETAGSSAYFERGFNVYSNPSKAELLGVKEETLQKYGAVSAECTAELALGALRHSHANVALAVSGVSGPTGGTLEKPVGLTYITLALQGPQALARLKSAGSPLCALYATQSDTLLYTGALHFLFSGQERALAGTLADGTLTAGTLTDASVSTAGAENAGGAFFTRGPALRAGAGSPPEHQVASRAREQLAEICHDHLGVRDSSAGAQPQSSRSRSQSYPPAYTALQRVEVLLPWPDPKAYPLPGEAYALRARLQEAVVREALSALGACLKGEPLLDYVEYIIKVNFQDNS